MPNRDRSSAIVSNRNRINVHNETARSSVWNEHVPKALRALEGGSCVEIQGTRWSGRTELLNSLCAEIKEVGKTPIVVRGVADAPPLEAIRAALPPTQSTQSRYESPVGSLAQRLFELASSPLVLVVDDVDLLDRASWSVIEATYKRTQVPVLATSLLQPRDSMPVNSVARIGHPMTSIVLGELRLDAMHDLLEAFLGGAVSLSLAARVHTKSGGIPGVAIAIAHTARDSGRLRRQGAYLSDASDLWSDDLRGVFEAFLLSYPPEISEALEILALAGTVYIEDGGNLVGHEELERLEGYNLVRLFNAGRRNGLAVNPPGLGTYFCNAPESARRLRLRSHMERILGRAVPTQSVADRPRRFSAAIRQNELPLVSRMLTDSHSEELSDAWRKWGVLPTPQNGSRVLALELTSPRVSDRVGSDHRRVMIDPEAPEAELGYRYLRARWLTDNDYSFDDVITALTARPGFAYAAALEVLIEAMRMERFGISTDYEARLSPYLEHKGWNGTVAHLVLATIYSVTGDGAKAIQLLERCTERAVSRYVAMIRGLALLADGRAAEAIEHAMVNVGELLNGSDHSAIVAHSYVATAALLALGRYEEAFEAGNVVLSARLRAADLLFAPDRALMMALAISTMRVGSVQSGHALLELARQFRGRSEALPLGAINLQTAVSALSTNDSATAALEFAGVAQGLASARLYSAATAAVAQALLSGHDHIAAEVLQPRHAPRYTRLVCAYLEANQASDAKDADSLVSAARILVSEQATEEAVKHLSRAARVYRDRGLHDRSRYIVAELQELRASDAVDGMVPGTPTGLEWDLTRREQEIVGDVAAGMSNTELAGKYGVSVRTIETHLRNIRQKTGCSSRTDIAAISIPLNAYA